MGPLAWLRRVWRQDRIRCSPSDGELLRLRIGAVLSVDDRFWLVRQRTTGSDCDGAFVIYVCDEGADTAELSVRGVVAGSAPRLSWSARGDTRSLAIADVEVFP